MIVTLTASRNLRAHLKFKLVNIYGQNGDGEGGASWLSGSMRDLQARDRGFDPRLGWIMLRRCAPRQGTLPTRALSRPRSKWVPGRAVKACVLSSSVHVRRNW